MTTWVLLRGLTREARHWGAFRDAFQAALPPGDLVLAPDLPGNGSHWQETSPHSADAMLQRLRTELAAEGHCGPYVLVALSLGGMIALRWAGLYSRELQGCVLINSSVGGMSPFWKRLRPRSYCELLVLLLAGRTPRDRERAVLRLTSNLPLHARTIDAWAEVAASAPVSRANALRQLVAAARFRGSRAAPPVPMLLLASGGDRLVHVDCSRRIARAWNAPMREHPSAGHDLPLDDPEWVVNEITAWRRDAFAS